MGIWIATTTDPQEMNQSESDLEYKFDIDKYGNNDHNNHSICHIGIVDYNTSNNVGRWYFNDLNTDAAD